MAHVFSASTLDHLPGITNFLHPMAINIPPKETMVSWAGINEQDGWGLFAGEGMSAVQRV